MLLQSFLEQNAAGTPDKVGLICDQQRWTYRQLDEQANRLAHLLRSGGVEPGDRVVIHLDNSSDAAIALFAVLKAGAVFVVLHPTTKPEKLAYVLDDANARALITDQRKLASSTALTARLSALDLIYVVDRDQPESSATEKTVWNRSNLPSDPAANQAPHCSRIDIDLAALIYTSGSTGSPKGVMMTHANMVAAATSISTYLRWQSDEIVLCALPLSFDYGLYQWLMTVKMGSTLVLERSFAYPAAILQRLVQEKVNGFPLVPTLLAILLRVDLSPYDLSALRYVTNTGAALPIQHILELRRRLPELQIFSMYGLTECKRVAYLPPEEIDSRPGSVGKAMPNTQAYVINENGERAKPDEVGQLVVRGSHVMLGYWRDPEASARVLKPDVLPYQRILHTGDLFRCDEDGYLYFVGRTDDIIKSRGEKVSPREVEEVIHRLDGVVEVAVVGVKDPVLGQAIKAFVTARDGVKLDAAAVKAHCARHLESFMVPTHVEIRTDLPRTAVGKIDRRTLEAEAAAHHA